MFKNKVSYWGKKKREKKLRGKCFEAFLARLSRCFVLFFFFYHDFDSLVVCLSGWVTQENEK